jgi:hypothetical protein
MYAVTLGWVVEFFFFFKSFFVQWIMVGSGLGFAGERIVIRVLPRLAGSTDGFLASSILYK